MENIIKGKFGNKYGSSRNVSVLIVTGAFGLGHKSAAEALKDELYMQDNTIKIEEMDILEYVSPRLHSLIYSSYNVFVDKFHRVYNMGYRMLEEQEATALGRALIDSMMIKRIDKFLSNNHYDVIISTLPITSRWISKYKRIYKSDIPLITCITDISPHSEWINSFTDKYIVATECVKDELRIKGVSQDNILVKGIPVRREFKEESIINSLEDNDENKKILIMGGGLGLLNFDDEFYREINSLKGRKTTIITGKNEKLYKKLYRAYENIEVIGYTTKVSEYMKRADILISKAGGITMFEAIYSELPILVFKPFLEQEIINARFIEMNGIGKVIREEKSDMIYEIEKMINNDTIDKYKDGICRVRDKIEDIPLIDIIKEVIIKEEWHNVV